MVAKLITALFFDALKHVRVVAALSQLYEPIFVLLFSFDIMGHPTNI